MCACVCVTSLYYLKPMKFILQSEIPVGFSLDVLSFLIYRFVYNGLFQEIAVFFFASFGVMQVGYVDA